MKLNIVEIEKYKQKYGSEKTIKKYEQAILENKNSYLSLWFAKNIEGANIDLHSKIITESKDLEYNYLFVKNLKGINIEPHEKIIIESKDPKYNYLFAKDIKMADINSHEKVILESKDLEYNYLFAKDIKLSKRNLHAKIITESKDLEYNYLFARDVDKINIEPHARIILDSQDIKYNYLFARDVDKINIEPHARIILDSQDIKYNYLFLRHIKNIDIQKHLDVVMGSNNPKHTVWKELLMKLFQTEETLLIIKPDGMKNIDKIIDMIYKDGLKIKKYKISELNKEILEEHYSHLINKPFYPVLESYMLSGNVALMILEGYNAVEKLRNLMGPTDSAKAPKGTIRGEFGTDITKNAVHGSDSRENALIEINRFFCEKEKIKTK